MDHSSNNKLVQDQHQLIQGQQASFQLEMIKLIRHLLLQYLYLIEVLVFEHLLLHFQIHVHIDHHILIHPLMYHPYQIL